MYYKGLYHALMHFMILNVRLYANQFVFAEFDQLNPLHYVPVLVDGDVVIADSFAILLVGIFDCLGFIHEKIR